MQRGRQIFDIPLSSQRYTRVKEYIQREPSVKSVTDFGCGNGRFVLWLKQIQQLEKIICVDTDYSLLEYELDNCYFKPGLCEALFGRENGATSQLVIELYHGDVVVPDSRLQSDCIVMIELIEHMSLTDVEKATRSVFGFYKPKMVVITTPNREFNHLLRGASESSSCFRHFDHKFEWNRFEFQQWANYVINNFPYSVQFDGVGHLPQSEPYGPCTQIAVFRCTSTDYNQTFETGLEAFDLLMNKLSVKDNLQEFSMERRKNEPSKIIEYIIPAAVAKDQSADQADQEPEDFQWDLSAQQ